MTKSTNHKEKEYYQQTTWREGKVEDKKKKKFDGISSLKSQECNRMGSKGGDASYTKRGRYLPGSKRMKANIDVDAGKLVDEVARRWRVPTYRFLLFWHHRR